MKKHITIPSNHTISRKANATFRSPPILPNGRSILYPIAEEQSQYAGFDIEEFIDRLWRLKDEQQAAEIELSKK